MRAATTACAIVAAFAVMCSAIAHPMDVRAGEFEWTSSGFIVRVSEDQGSTSHGESPNHEHTRAGRNSIEWHAAFDIRDERGETVTPVSIHDESAHATTVLSYQSATKAVTIMLNPAAIGDSPLRQIQLWERGVGADEGRTYRLTRRGNVEIVCRPNHGVIESSKGDQSPRLVVSASPTACRGSLVTPIQLLPPFDDASTDVAPAIDRTWLTTNREHIAAWVRDHLHAVGEDGSDLSPVVTRIDVLRPDGSVANDEAEWPLNALMARVRIEFAFMTEQREVESIVWTGFSPRVQRIRYEVIHDGATAHRGLLNAYSNSFRPGRSQ